MFLTLMRKDLSVIVKPMVVAVIVTSSVEFGVQIASTVAMVRQLQGPYAARENALRDDVMFVLCCCFAAIASGAALPIERRQGWVDFAAMMPVSRQRQMLARILVASALAIVACGSQLAPAFLFFRATHPNPSARAWTFFDCVAIRQAFSIWVSIFGVAWLGAACLRSAAINVAIAVAIPLGGLFLIHELANAGGRKYEASDGIFYPATVMVGIAALVIGTIVMTRRIER